MTGGRGNRNCHGSAGTLREAAPVGITKRGRAGMGAVIIGAASFVLLAASGCGSSVAAPADGGAIPTPDGAETITIPDGAGAITTPGGTASVASLDDASMRALRATASATTFVVEIDGENWPTQSLRYTAPFTYESTVGAPPMLVVDGVQYDHLPTPPSGAVENPDALIPLALNIEGGGPMTVPFFVDLLHPASRYGGPGYRIVSVETDGTRATVVRAETSLGPIELRFSDFDVPTTPPTAPTNTVPSGGL